MATNPYLSKMPQYAFNALTFNHRNGAYPLDDTSVWNTKAQFVEYLEEAGTYAYAGQIVAIANGSVDAENGSKDYSLAIVRSDGSCQMVGEHVFDDADAAQAWVTANADAAHAGMVLSVKNGESDYALYVVNAGKTITRVSFSQTDIPEVTWAALKNKPTSAVEDIDAAVTFSKKFTAAEESVTYGDKTIAFVSDIPTTYDVAKLDGIIGIEHLPASVMERLVVVGTKAEMLALTADQIQAGDSVKVTKYKENEDDPKETARIAMFFVKTNTTVGTMEAFEEYQVGSAASVPWTGVTGIPSDIVYADTMVDTAATASKIVKRLEDGTIAGTVANATTLNGHEDTYFATAEALTQEIKNRGVAEKAITDAATALTARVAANEGNITTLQGDMTTAKADIAALKDGSALTSVDAGIIKNVIKRENLPADVSGKTVLVADKAEMLTLTAEQINVGDLVKLADGNVYMFNTAAAIKTEAGFELIHDTSAKSVDWDEVQNKPKNFVFETAVSAEATADMIVKRDSTGKIAGTVANAETLGNHAADYFAVAETTTQEIEGLKTCKIAASRVDGVLSIDNIPAAAVERLSIVVDKDALLALTTDTVQNGDTVKVTKYKKDDSDTEHEALFFVKDASKLGTAEAEKAFEEYTVGSAASVPWTGITGIPAAIIYFNNDEIVEAVKDAIVKKHAHANAAVLDKMTENATGALLHGEKELAYKADVAALGTIPVLDAAPADAFDGQLYFQTIVLA